MLKSIGFAFRVISGGRPRRAMGIALATMLSFGPLVASAAGLIAEETQLPVEIDGQALHLQTLIIHLNDGQRHPLAVISHGRAETDAERKSTTPWSLIRQGVVFARRGWTVAIVIRQGYGKSEGPNRESTFGSCSVDNYLTEMRAATGDVKAAVTSLRKLPYVDPDRMIAIGQSAGGLTTVALTADPPSGLQAAIAFAPGNGSDGNGHVCGAQNLVNAYGEWGKTSHTPLLWVVTENDHFFPPDLANQFHAAFAGSGGDSEFHMEKPFGADGHHYFEQSLGWSALVDQFLAAQHLQLVPSPITIDTATTPPRGLSVNGLDSFDIYSMAPGHKAFAASADGKHSGSAYGRDSTDEALKDALGKCHGACSAYMIDDHAAN